MNILVIDVGSSGMRGLLFTESGTELTRHECVYHMSYGEDGLAEEDAADWQNALYRILGDISEKARDNGWSVDAISLTSQRSSLICMDRDFHPLRPAIMWQDKRTNEICERLGNEDDRIFSLCGATVNPVFSGTKMMWVHEEEPEIYDKTYKFMGVAEYLIYLMTGSVCTDRTYASRSLLMNLRTGEWDDELLGIFHVDKDKLCDILPPGSICGYTTKELNSLTGFPSGVPVITAGGDQQCSAVGQGVIHEGVLSINAGTGGFLIAATGRVPDDLKPDVICNAASLPGLYILETSMLTCCSAFDWFTRNFYNKCSYDLINSDVDESPAGANGVICVPYFQGRSTPDWNNYAKGGFLGVTLNTSRGDMLRSLLEGISYEIANETDIIEKYVALSEIYINGGLTNSRPFNGILCNVLDTMLTRRGGAYATAVGALLVAETTLEVYGSAEDVFNMLESGKVDQIYTPDEELAAFYKKHRAEMNELYSRLYTP